MKDKKAISTLVATVLLILIVVAMVLIIWQFLLPVISNSSELGRICADSRVRIDLSSGYTCYSTARDYSSIMIIQESERPLAGFQISLSETGDKTMHKVKSDSKLIFLAEFEEAKGSLSLEAISGRSFTINNPSWTFGKIGYAVQYNGKSTYADAPLNDSQQISIETWVKPQ